MTRMLYDVKWSCKWMLNVECFCFPFVKVLEHLPAVSSFRQALDQEEGSKEKAQGTAPFDCLQRDET